MSTFHVRSFGAGTITAVDARSAQSFPRHSHDEFGVGLITSGAQRSWSGRGPVEAYAGNLITVNPGEVHDGAPIGPERGWSMLYLPLEIVAPIIADCSEGNVAIPELKAPMIDDVRLSRIFTAARAALIEEKDGEVFNELLQVLLGALFNSKVQPAPVAPHRLIQARERIDDDPAAGHSLVDLASLVGLSRFQTLRAFAELTGLTPHAYVIQRRLDAARRLIRGGSSLASAAAGAGFADQSHMHRAFIARYGYTPGAYRGADLQFCSRASCQALLDSQGNS